MTLNQLVGGSIPLRPTNKNKHLRHFAESAFFVSGCLGQTWVKKTFPDYKNPPSRYREETPYPYPHENPTKESLLAKLAGVGRRFAVWFHPHGFPYPSPSSTSISQATFSKISLQKIPTYERFSTRSPSHPTHGIHPVVIIPRSAVYGVFLARRPAQGH